MSQHQPVNRLQGFPHSEQWSQVFYFSNFTYLLYENGYKSGDFVLQASSYDS